MTNLTTITNRRSLWYTITRWAGRVAALVVLSLLVTTPTTPLWGETLTIPPKSVYDSWTSEARRAFDWKLGGINTGMSIASGELVPGQVIDLSLPPVNMMVQLYRWSEYWGRAQKKSALDYQELLQWRRFYDSVESCDSWLERQRKMGIGYFTPRYPIVIDTGIPDYDTYTNWTLEPVYPVVPDVTFSIAKPWLWGR